MKDIDKENSKLEAKKVKAEITRLMLEVPAFLSEGSKMEQMTIPTYETCWNSVGVDGRKMIGVDFEANGKRKNSRRLVRVKCLCQTIRV